MTGAHVNTGGGRDSVQTFITTFLDAPASGAHHADRNRCHNASPIAPRRPQTVPGELTRNPKERNHANRSPGRVGEAS
jgi:hypothetical protein